MTISRDTVRGGPSAWRALAAIDLRSLAAMRIGLGLVLLGDLITRAQFLTLHYSGQSPIPWAELPGGWRDPWKFCAHIWSGGVGWQITLFMVAGFAALALITGRATRVATIVSWLLLGSIHARAPMLVGFGDNLLRLLLFWSIFLPLGARWSLDAGRRAGPISGGGGASFSSIASFALLFQTVSIYLFVFFNKDHISWWTEGSALWYALQLDDSVRPLGAALLSMGDEVLSTLTRATYLTQVLGIILVWVPWKNAFWRVLVVGMFWAEHIAIEATMEVGWFSMVVLVAWLPFLPGEFWGFLSRGRSWGRNIAVGVVRERSALKQVSAGLALCLALWLNLTMVVAFRPYTHFPDALQPLVSMARLDQEWMMFAFPVYDDGWLVLEAELSDDERVDLRRDGAPVSFEHPTDLGGTFPTHSARLFEEYLWRNRDPVFLERWVRSVCTDWDERHPERTVRRTRLHLFTEQTDAQRATSPVHREVLVGLTF